MAKLEYVVIDCFTRNPLEGNQLAVVLDGRGLSTEMMQRLAKETNLSETTFILPGEGNNGAHRVRIFTVDEELPFAGHPTVGTATVLRQMNGGTEVVLDLNVGRVPVQFEQRAGMWFGEMQQRDPQFGQIHNVAEVAKAAGLREAAIATSWPVQTTNTGMPFAIVPLQNVEALRAMRFDWQRASEYLVKTDAKFFYFIARDEGAVNQIEARMIFYNGEDPATGSAAGCCVAWAVKHRFIKSEESTLVRQGAMVRRPSEIFVRATLDKEDVRNVRVGGFCAPVARGTFEF
ncbi:MAG: PhzF family phenazine biosynthesis protein [Acidobacteriaceae bacterium]